MERNGKIKLLFICSANTNRSPTFERQFKKLLPKKYPEVDWEVRSAGCWYGYPYQVDEDILRWADKIYLMDLSHERFILEKYPDAEIIKKLVLVGVSDQYDADGRELIDLIHYWFRAKFPETIDLPQ